ncbi:MAG: divalent-cation tolerance protein CutA [Nitrospiraceae bacterium]
MVLKSRADLFEELAATIKTLHSYRVPEIIALPITRGSPDYLAWIRDVTRKRK